MWFIYFILNRQSGAVKIGLTQDPERRLSELQTGCCSKLELLGTCSGGSYKLEKTIHHALEPWSLSGEWFTYAKYVQEFITYALTFGVGAALPKLQNEAVRAEENRHRAKMNKAKQERENRARLLSEIRRLNAIRFERDISGQLLINNHTESAWDELLSKVADDLQKQRVYR